MLFFFSFRFAQFEFVEVNWPLVVIVYWILIFLDFTAACRSILFESTSLFNKIFMLRCEFYFSKFWDLICSCEKEFCCQRRKLCCSLVSLELKLIGESRSSGLRLWSWFTGMAGEMSRSWLEVASIAREGLIGTGEDYSRLVE